MGLILPKFIQENWSYKDENNKICLKEDAPEWAKEEYKTFLKMLNSVPDEKGMIKEY